MKNNYLLILVALLFAGQLLAKSEYQISVATVGMSMDYSEYSDSGELYDTEESSLNDILGIELKLSETKQIDRKTSLTRAIRLMNVGGNTKYVGSIIGSGEGYGSYVGSTYNSIKDFEVEYLFTYTVKANLDFSYGAGFGYRQWDRELSASQIEIYSWYSLRPKVSIIYKADDFSIAAALEYQHGLFPQMSFDMSGRSIVLDLGAANITQLTLPLRYKYSDKVVLFTQYVYQMQIIEKSNVVDGWLEPRSEAYNQYVKFGAEFKF